MIECSIDMCGDEGSVRTVVICNEKERKKKKVKL